MLFAYSAKMSAFFRSLFSRAANPAKRARALRAAEKLTVAPSCACFVTGHDFSRAATALKSTPGFSPCYDSFHRLLEFRSFSAACLAPGRIWASDSNLTKGSFTASSFRSGNKPIPGINSPLPCPAASKPDSNPPVTSIEAAPLLSPHLEFGAHLGDNLAV